MPTILARLRRFSAATLRPVVAGLLVAIILVIGLLSIRPDWHELVCHHHDNPASDACAHHAHDGHTASADAGDQHDGGSDESGGCAVSLFGHGHVLALAPCALIVPDTRLTGDFATFEAIILARTAYLLPQGHAPPAV